MAEYLGSRLVVDALALAVQRRLPAEKLLAHFDPRQPVHQRPLPTPPGEGWHHMQQEPPGTRSEARAAIVEYMEVFYNTQRRHSPLGYVSLAEYEQSE